MHGRYASHSAVQRPEHGSILGTDSCGTRWASKTMNPNDSEGRSKYKKLALLHQRESAYAAAGLDDGSSCRDAVVSTDADPLFEKAIADYLTWVGEQRGLYNGGFPVLREDQGGVAQRTNRPQTGTTNGYSGAAKRSVGFSSCVDNTSTHRTTSTMTTPEATLGRSLEAVRGAFPKTAPVYPKPVHHTVLIEGKDSTQQPLTAHAGELGRADYRHYAGNSSRDHARMMFTACDKGVGPTLESSGRQEETMAMNEPTIVGTRETMAMNEPSKREPVPTNSQRSPMPIAIPPAPVVDASDCLVKGPFYGHRFAQSGGSTRQPAINSVWVIPERLAVLVAAPSPHSPHSAVDVATAAGARHGGGGPVAVEMAALLSRLSQRGGQLLLCDVNEGGLASSLTTAAKSVSSYTQSRNTKGVTNGGIVSNMAADLRLSQTGNEVSCTLVGVNPKQDTAVASTLSANAVIRDRQIKNREATAEKAGGAGGRRAEVVQQRWAKEREEEARSMYTTVAQASFISPAPEVTAACGKAAVRRGGEGRRVARDSPQEAKRDCSTNADLKAVLSHICDNLFFGPHTCANDDRGTIPSGCHTSVPSTVLVVCSDPVRAALLCSCLIGVLWNEPTMRAVVLAERAFTVPAIDPAGAGKTLYQTSGQQVPHIRAEDAQRWCDSEAVPPPANYHGSYPTGIYRAVPQAREQQCDASHTSLSYTGKKRVADLSLSALQCQATRIYALAFLKDFSYIPLAYRSEEQAWLQKH